MIETFFMKSTQCEKTVSIGYFLFRCEPLILNELFKLEVDHIFCDLSAHKRVNKEN